MTVGLTSVDVAALASELHTELAGSRVDKAYQPAPSRILLRLRQRGAGKKDLLVEVGRFACLVRRVGENPEKPSMVAQILRKELDNARLRAVQQVGFDRILRLDFDRGDGPRSLVFELFGDGNMLLLDGSQTILLPLRGAEYGARRLKKGEPYAPPPGPAHPLQRDPALLYDDWVRSGRDLVRFLAGVAGFGPKWAEEIVARASTDKHAKPAPDVWEAVAAQLALLRRELERADLAPTVYLDGEGHPVDATPWPLATSRGPVEETHTFSEAVETLFLGAMDAEAEPDDPRRARFEAARGKLLRQRDDIVSALAAFDAEAERGLRAGQALQRRGHDLAPFWQAVRDARTTGGWQTLADIVPPAGTRVVEVREHEGMVLTEVDGVPLALDIRKGIQENAQDHYAMAKKAKSRREGAEGARRETERRLAELEAAGLDAFGPAPARVERSSRHYWFENYRWTITPGGFVAVGGRSAAQNDAVVKKYLRDGDRYVHAEIHGAPSVVVRRADGPPTEPPPEDLRAACQFAVVASRAWRQFGHASAYWVMASQVSKTARSGEFVPKGAWMVHGKRNVESDLPMEWFVARVRMDAQGNPLRRDDARDGGTQKLVGATRASLRPYAAKALRLVPGDVAPQDAAQAVSEWAQVGNEEAAAVLPAGMVSIEGEVDL